MQLSWVLSHVGWTFQERSCHCVIHVPGGTIETLRTALAGLVSSCVWRTDWFEKDQVLHQLWGQHQPHLLAHRQRMERNFFGRKTHRIKLSVEKNRCQIDNSPFPRVKYIPISFLIYTFRLEWVNGLYLSPLITKETGYFLIESSA